MFLQKYTIFGSFPRQLETSKPAESNPQMLIAESNDQNQPPAMQPTHFTLRLTLIVETTLYLINVLVKTANRYE